MKLIESAAAVKNLGLGVALLAGTVAAVLAVRWVYTNRERFNPTSDKNFAYSGVNAVGSALTGDKDWSLGVAIYEAVDKVQDVLPFVDSDAERAAKAAAQRQPRTPEPTPESGGWQYYAP